MSSTTNQIARNPKQYQFLQRILNNTADYDHPKKGTYQTGFKATMNASRGFGKTVTLLDIAAMCVKSLPRSVGAVWSKTYTHVQNIILSQSNKVFEEHGLFEFDDKVNPYGNYVVNKKPPANWPKPYNSPRNYENTMSFANGAMIKMVSADRPDSSRGNNFDWLLGDEVAFTKREFYTKVLLPTNRANARIYHDPRPGRERYNHPLHWLSVNFSSLPYSISGRWFLEMEELANENPERYEFMRATAMDNLMNLPGDYIEAARKELSAVEFMVEIENKLLDKLPNAFYSGFDYERNVDTRYTYEFQYVKEENKNRHVSIDQWYNPMKPIDMSWDFNGYFTCCVLGQDFIKEYGEYVFNDMIYAKESRTTLVDLVCSTFIDNYRHHVKKVVYLYGDRSGNDAAADRNIPLFAEIELKLRKAGWEVILNVANTYPGFQHRYMLINDLLAEVKDGYPKLRYHEEKCRALIGAIQNTKVEKGTFQKFKGEEGPDKIPQEHAPHPTDAMDYLLMQKFNSYSVSSSARTSPIKVRKR